MKRIGALLTIALATGCAAAQPSWEAAGLEWFRKGGTHEEFLTDKAECEGRGGAAASAAEGSISESQLGGIGSETVATCLRERGYRPWGERDAYDRARETLPMR